MDAANSNILQHVAKHREYACILLTSLVNQNTFTANFAGVNRAQEIFAAELQKLGLDFRFYDQKSAGKFLVARTKCASSENTGDPATGRASGPICLVGHMDTVHPPDSSFKAINYECLQDGSMIAKGPGALDMKGGLVVIWWALKVLHCLGSLQNLPLKIIVNSEEETGSPNTRELLTYECANAQAALVFEFGREADGIILRRRGICVFEIKVTGREAHSGNNHRKGVSAIVRLAAIITGLQELNDYARNITVNVGTISGGSAVNTVSGAASALCELRFESSADFKELRLRIDAIIAQSHVEGSHATLAEKMFMPPLEADAASRSLFESFSASAAKFGDSLPAIESVVGGGSDANYCGTAGIACIDGLGPFGEHPHTENEYVRIDSMQRKSLHLAAWLHSLDISPPR